MTPTTAALVAENGTCKERTLCNGVVGYDGPTGVGTPNGAKLASGT